MERTKWTARHEHYVVTSRLCDMYGTSPNSLYLIILVCVLYIESLYATYVH